jgi:hypothetical protein
MFMLLSIHSEFLTEKTEEIVFSLFKKNCNYTVKVNVYEVHIYTYIFIFR